MSITGLHLRDEWRAKRAFAAAHFAISKRVLYIQPTPLPSFAALAFAKLRQPMHDEDICVIDDHAITLATLPHDAVIYQNTVAIPGFDHRGRPGWLVLKRNEPVYFSRARTVGRAVDDLRESLQRRRGTRSALASSGGFEVSAADAPRWLWCRFETIIDSDFGQWTAEAMLQRANLFWLAKRLNGLPCFLLRNRGEVGRSAIAQTLVRNVLERDVALLRSSTQ